MWYTIVTMAANSFGTIFRITTFGESHGKAIGVVVDGCPSGLELTEDDINKELVLRAPGRSTFTSPRKEPDYGQIISGVFEGKTTGTPICILIHNVDHDSNAYEAIKNKIRPGHANGTYLEKYGVFDYRGGGRASARETACRVAAGAIAKKLLSHYGIAITAYCKQIGHIQADVSYSDVAELRRATYKDPVYCPHTEASSKMQALLQQVQADGDSLGGLVECVALNVPAGLGDPVYQKFEAQAASAMMSIPASKGFEIGSGFSCVTMNGSQHNDISYAGGTLGGITTGTPIVVRVAFKPPSSIKKEVPEGSRHDPCVTIRAVPVVEAMMALVLADALLMNRSIRL